MSKELNVEESKALVRELISKYEAYREVYAKEDRFDNIAVPFGGIVSFLMIDKLENNLDNNMAKVLVCLIEALLIGHSIYKSIKSNEAKKALEYLKNLKSNLESGTIKYVNKDLLESKKGFKIAVDQYTKAHRFEKIIKRNEEKLEKIKKGRTC